eukprot:2186041-Prymnesium_polylepis.2
MSSRRSRITPVVTNSGATKAISRSMSFHTRGITSTRASSRAMSASLLTSFGLTEDLRCSRNKTGFTCIIRDNRDRRRLFALPHLIPRKKQRRRFLKTVGCRARRRQNIGHVWTSDEESTRLAGLDEMPALSFTEEGLYTCRGGCGGGGRGCGRRIRRRARDGGGSRGCGRIIRTRARDRQKHSAACGPVLPEACAGGAAGRQ